MQQKSKVGVLLTFIFLLVTIVVLSYFIVPMWGEKAEKRSAEMQLNIGTEMSVGELILNNNLEKEIVNKALTIDATVASDKTLKDLGITEKEAIDKITKAVALKTEEESKNWVKIPIKIISWVIWLTIAFIFLRKNKITSKTRKYLLFGTLAIFGIILGTEPNPMSTVKDNIVTITINGVVFPPRIVVMTLFLLTIFFANKFICAWGCQLGTLQDLIFRLNRNKEDTKGIIKQYKVPFAMSNTFRIIFFITFLVVLIAWSVDIIEIINPFKIYNPAALTAGGVIFLSLILIASLFIYRPWCHLFCPLGLVGWLVEKFSRNKIIVNHKTCIACGKCSKACPSLAMEAILKQNKTTPDCFSCATCINVCPTKSITFDNSKRNVPPAEKYTSENTSIET